MRAGGSLPSSAYELRDRPRDVPFYLGDCLDLLGGLPEGLARRHGLNFVGVEMDKGYLEEAIERVRAAR